MIATSAEEVGLPSFERTGKLRIHHLQALCCNLFSSPYHGNEKRSHPQRDDFFFGDLERTRTVDLQRDRLAC